MSFVSKLIKSGSVPIHFMRGKDPEGRDAYYFVMCSHKKIELIKNTEKEVINVHDYGKVVASGFGAEPSDEVKQMLKDEYGFDAESLL